MNTVRLRPAATPGDHTFELVDDAGDRIVAVGEIVGSMPGAMRAGDPIQASLRFEGVALGA
jgi:hypothetical protein